MLHFHKVLKNISGGLLSCATRLKCFYLAVMDYLATFSRRLSIANMKIAAMIHRAMRIAQLYMRGILFHSADGIELK